MKAIKTSVRNYSKHLLLPAMTGSAAATGSLVSTMLSRAPGRDRADEDVTTELMTQVEVCEKQVVGDGSGLSGMVRGSGRMIKQTQKACPSTRGIAKELNRMSLDALEIVDARLPDTNLLTPFEVPPTALYGPQRPFHEPSITFHHLP